MRTLSILALAVALTGCGLDKFDVELAEQATIPAGPSGTPIDDSLELGASFSGIDLFAQPELEREGIDAGDLDSAKIDVVQLEVVSGSAFETWLDGVAVYVEAEGLERALVASKADVGAMPAGTVLLDLDTSGVELKPYVAKPMSIKVDVAGAPPAQDTTVRARVVVGVDADVSNFLGM